MADEEKEVHIDHDDARAAQTTGVMRYVLGISLLLAIIAMTLVWVIPALSEGEVETAGTATERAEEMREDGVAQENIPGRSDGNPNEAPTSARMAPEPSESDE